MFDFVNNNLAMTVICAYAVAALTAYMCARGATVAHRTNRSPLVYMGITITVQFAMVSLWIWALFADWQTTLFASAIAYVLSAIVGASLVIFTSKAYVR